MAARTKTLADSTTLSDTSPSKVFARNKPLADTTTLSESGPQTAFARLRFVADGYATNDGGGAILSFSRSKSITDSYSYSDTLPSSVFGRNKTLSDSLPITDSLNVAGQKILTLEDGLVLVDLRSSAVRSSIVDFFSYSDDDSPFFGRDTHPRDTFQISDSLTSTGTKRVVFIDDSFKTLTIIAPSTFIRNYSELEPNVQALLLSIENVVSTALQISTVMIFPVEVVNDGTFIFQLITKDGRTLTANVLVSEGDIPTITELTLNTNEHFFTPNEFFSGVQPIFGALEQLISEHIISVNYTRKIF